MKGGIDMKQTYIPPEAILIRWQPTDIITVSGVTLFDEEGNPIGDSFYDIVD